MKLDITRVEGYREDMSAEEKLKLYETAEIDMSAFVPKNTADKYASEAADWKKKYNATLSEQERKDAEETEKRSQMEQELNFLRQERTIDQHTARFLELGFDGKLAKSTAQALAEGKMDDVFAGYAAHQKAMEAKIRADVLKGTPTPKGGVSGAAGNDYGKMAEQAQANGDMAAAMYYTRLAQQVQTE